MLSSIDEMGGKLDEGMWAIDFHPRHLTNRIFDQMMYLSA